MSLSRGRESAQRGWASVDPGLIPTRGGEWGGGAWGITRDQTGSRGLEGRAGQQAFSLSFEDPCP